ncbi:hypothetical protein ACHAWF_018938, partial [Thalassiosira exigua]
MASKRSSSIVAVMAMVAAMIIATAAFADAFSQPAVASVGSLRTGPPRFGVGLALHYKNYHASYYENVDVDGDRMSLLSLLDPPSAPLASPRKKSSSSTSGGARAATRRASPVTELRSIQDYHRHVLHHPGELCVVRFSAPWCQVCRSTDVAWERMAAKICKANERPSGGGDGTGTGTGNGGRRSKRIKFFSVSVDGKDERTAALKDMLQIGRVPQGIVHHPSEGVFGRKIDLHRSNLSTLKKRLESYVGEEGSGGGGGT